MRSPWDDTQDEVNALVDDVEMIAEDFYGDDFDDDCDDDCDCCDDSCDCCDEDCDCEDQLLYEVTCPQCDEKIYLDEEMLDDGAVQCPACGCEIELELEEDTEEKDEPDAES